MRNTSNTLRFYLVGGIIFLIILVIFYHSGIMEEGLDLIQSECNQSSDTINNMEEFYSNESPTSQILLFLSDTCPFCQKFIKYN